MKASEGRVPEARGPEAKEAGKPTCAGAGCGYLEAHLERESHWAQQPARVAMVCPLNSLDRELAWELMQLGDITVFSERPEKLGIGLYRKGVRSYVASVPCDDLLNWVAKGSVDICVFVLGSSDDFLFPLRLFVSLSAQKRQLARMGARAGGLGPDGARVNLGLAGAFPVVCAYLLDEVNVLALFNCFEAWKKFEEFWKTMALALGVYGDMVAQFLKNFHYDETMTRDVDIMWLVFMLSDLVCLGTDRIENLRRDLLFPEVLRSAERSALKACVRRDLCHRLASIYNQRREAQHERTVSVEALQVLLERGLAEMKKNRVSNSGLEQVFRDVVREVFVLMSCVPHEPGPAL